MKSEISPRARTIFLNRIHEVRRKHCLDLSDSIVPDEHHSSIALCTENRKIDLVLPILDSYLVPKTEKEFSFILNYRDGVLHLFISEYITSELAPKKLDELHLDHISEERKMVRKYDTKT